MPAATHDPAPTDDLAYEGQLAELSAITGDDSQTTTDVIGLAPTAGLAGDVSRAQALVLVASTDTAAAIEALHRLQADGRWELAEAPLAVWQLLGRPPQAAFVVRLPLSRTIARAAAPTVTRPLAVTVRPRPTHRTASPINPKET